MSAPAFRIGDAIVMLTYDQVEQIHDIALIEGGMPGVLSHGAIESALFRPQNLVDYQDCNDLILLAASLWYALSSAHGFCDGNKRTAVLSAFAFLEANGVEINPNLSSDDPGKFVDELYKRNDFEEKHLIAYLRARCRWILE